MLQELVAGAVTQGIIDMFEAVEIEDAHRKSLPHPLRLLDALTHPIIQQDPVGKAGQSIMGGQMAQLFIG